MSLLGKKSLLLFLLLVAAQTVVFWFSDIDLQVASFFYDPSYSQHWPLGEYPVWKFFYRLGPILTITIAISSLVVILLSVFKQSWVKYRIQAAFILFSFVLGPGLLVNSVFKDNWGRPRPAQIEPFSGSEYYIPPLKFNAAGDGKSFPSGHSSLGFGFIAFWFLWYRRRPRLAGYALGFSLVLGSLLGVARMAAGGHFLSDVFWSLWIPLLTCMGLYHFFFAKLLDADALETKAIPVWKNAIYALLAFFVLAYGLFNWPIKQSNQQIITSSPLIEIIADKTDLRVAYTKKKNPTQLELHHEVKGFGLPFSQQVLRVSQHRHGANSVVRIALNTKGIVTELHSKTTLLLPQNVVKQIRLTIKEGRLRTPQSLQPLLSYETKL